MTSVRILLTAAALLSGGLAQSATSPQGLEASRLSVLSSPPLGDTGLAPLRDARPRQADAQALLEDTALFSALLSLGLLEPGFVLDADLADVALFVDAYMGPGLDDAGGVQDWAELPMLDDNGHDAAVWAFQMPSRPFSAADPEIDRPETASGGGAYLFRDGAGYGYGLSEPHAAHTALLGQPLKRDGPTLPPGAELMAADAGDVTNASVHSPVSAVPEPTSSALMLVGLGCIGWAVVKRRRRFS